MLLSVQRKKKTKAKRKRKKRENNEAEDFLDFHSRRLLMDLPEGDHMPFWKERGRKSSATQVPRGYWTNDRSEEDDTGTSHDY